jgi:nitrogen fixation/metabolism regulation signal transduction histidine kinase
MAREHENKMVSGDELEALRRRMAGLEESNRACCEESRRLKESEEFATSLLTGTPHPVVVVNPDGSVRYLVRRGILGLNAPAAAVTAQPWNQEAMMVIYSDGVRSHRSREKTPGIELLSAPEVAGMLVRKYAGEEDDATVLVVKGRS